MSKISVLVLTVLALWARTYSEAAIIEENFSTDPLLRGWKIHGAGELFSWDSQGGAVQVTWDSSRTNSYFYRELGTTLTKADEFTLAFDLRLDEVTLGSFELAVGLLNLADATSPGFLRGTGSDSPNLVEFDYFPEWSSVDATTSDAAGAMQFNYDAPVSLEPGATYRIILKHAAGESLLTGEVYLAGGLYSSLSKSYPNSKFTDFRVDTLAISSYAAASSFDKLYVRGVVDNLALEMPFFVGNVQGAFSGTPWEVRVSSSTNCIYTLQRTADLKTWSEIGETVRGTGSELLLNDPNPPAGQAYYRVKATR